MASWVAFWASTAAIIGVVLLWQPEITADLGLTVPGKGLGIALLAAVAILMFWLSRGRHIQVRGETLELLGRRVTLLQCGAAMTDLAGSAAVLFVFLPAGVAGGAASFFGLFVVAVGFGVLSHAPAGLGAFEGTILLGLHEADRTGISSALVLYRLCRTVQPFLIASAVLGAFVLARPGPAQGPR